MHVIAVFFGIIITINFRDHKPPHLNAAHGGQKALFDLWRWRRTLANSQHGPAPFGAARAS